MDWAKTNVIRDKKFCDFESYIRDFTVHVIDTVDPVDKAHESHISFELQADVAYFIKRTDNRQYNKGSAVRGQILMAVNIHNVINTDSGIATAQNGPRHDPNIWNQYVRLLVVVFQPIDEHLLFLLMNLRLHLAMRTCDGL